MTPRSPPRSFAQLLRLGAKAKFPAPPLSPRAPRFYTPKECLSIVLTSEIGNGATGVAYRGTLKLNNGGGSTPLDVAVKLAFTSQQRDMPRGNLSPFAVQRRS